MKHLTRLTNGIAINLHKYGAILLLRYNNHLQLEKFMVGFERSQPFFLKYLSAVDSQVNHFWVT